MEAETTHTPEDIEEALDVVSEFMEETLTALDADQELEFEVSYEDGRIHAVLDGDRDDVGLLIGKRGQTLDAVQYLANALVGANCETQIPVQIDAQGYRDRRAAQLEKIADRAVADCLRTGDAIELEPMTSAERKVVHMYLKDHHGVETASEGREPNRRLVVSPRRD